MEENNWRLINTGYQSGAMNMALDEAILEAVKAGQVKPTIRFYAWQPAAISLGYFQKLDEEVDTTACQQQGIDIVRRLTGGRAVLHDDELTYSLIAPAQISWLPESIVKSYKIISQGLVLGLQQLGIPAEMIPLADKMKRERQSAACFDATSWYEVAVAGKKIIGSAQTRKQGMILQHGSIVRSQNLEQLFSILKFSKQRDKKRLKRLFSTKATSIQEVTDTIPTLKELREAFKIGFEDGLKLNLSLEEITDAELERATELMANKYQQRTWTHKR
ncbi:lipoate--protein ligase family protein [Natroniella sulfidigena]|uniref:lipoate--protein ligase family protein n=1 Tax=Natroniella sulfidigena TaxID=723921 RepID=UPI00200A91BF|nr:lipoate--protein ligase family protein [Natroniella sulfidigena]MCK8817732.1 lipoate--protein ligase family protein [Natroniella sulfidigena]